MKLNSLFKRVYVINGWDKPGSSIMFGVRAKRYILAHPMQKVILFACSGRVFTRPQHTEYEVNIFNWSARPKHAMVMVLDDDCVGEFMNDFSQNLCHLHGHLCCDISPCRQMVHAQNSGISSNNKLVFNRSGCVCLKIESDISVRESVGIEYFMDQAVVTQRFTAFYSALQSAGYFTDERDSTSGMVRQSCRCALCTSNYVCYVLPQLFRFAFQPTGFDKLPV